MPGSSFLLLVCNGEVLVLWIPILSRVLLGSFPFLNTHFVFEFTCEYSCMTLFLDKGNGGRASHVSGKVAEQVSLCGARRVCKSSFEETSETCLDEMNGRFCAISPPSFSTCSVLFLATQIVLEPLQIGVPREICRVGNRDGSGVEW